MSNSQPKKAEDSRQSQHLLRQKPSTSTAKKMREQRAYERLRGMVPQLSSKTDLTKVSEHCELFIVYVNVIRLLFELHFCYVLCLLSVLLITVGIISLLALNCVLSHNYYADLQIYVLMILLCILLLLRRRRRRPRNSRLCRRRCQSSFSSYLFFLFLIFISVTKSVLCIFLILGRNGRKNVCLLPQITKSYRFNIETYKRLKRTVV